MISEYRSTYKSGKRNDKGGAVTKITTTSFIANCQHRFKESRKKSENRLFDVINKKIDEFFESAEYNFSLSEPKTTATVAPISPPKKIFAASLFRSNASSNQNAAGGAALPPVETSPFLMDLISFSIFFANQ